MNAHDRIYSVPTDSTRAWASSPLRRSTFGQFAATNSLGSDFAIAITASEYKMAQKQKDRSGGYILMRFAP